MPANSETAEDRLAKLGIQLPDALRRLAIICPSFGRATVELELLEEVTT